MTITFGSFGDIITAVQVAYKLLEILNTQRGAKCEFEDLIVDLRLFHRFLDQLLSFWQTREQCPLLDNLYDILQPVICDAKGEISAFLEKLIAKYGTVLNSPSKRNPKHVGKMLQWHLFERDEITRLQDKLRKSKEVIMMVQCQANSIAEEKNRGLVNKNMRILTDAEEEATAKLKKRLDGLEESAKRQSEILNHIYNCIKSVSTAIVPVASAAVDLPTMLAKIYSELLSHRNALRTLNPYAQNSAFVEDALGWTIPIPLEVVISWDTLHSILLDKFANGPGYRLVKEGRYVMRDDLNGIELCRDVSLTSMLHPGRKINMSMVYFSAPQQIMVCPKCKTPILVANEPDITCMQPKCGMQIQRIEEVEDVEHIEESLKATASMSNDEGRHHSEADFDELWAASLALPASTNDDPGVFKRIRYISRWEHRPESRGRLFFQAGQCCLWTTRCSEAGMICRSLAEVLQSTVSGRISGNNSCSAPRVHNWDTQVYIRTFFVGSSLMASKPIVVFFSTQKKLCRDARKRAMKLDWVKAHPSLVPVTASSSIFRDSIKQTWDRKMAAKRVYGSRLETLRRS